MLERSQLPSKLRTNALYRSEPTREIYLFKKPFTSNDTLQPNFSASNFCHKSVKGKISISTRGRSGSVQRDTRIPPVFQ